MLEALSGGERAFLAATVALTAAAGVARSAGCRRVVLTRSPGSTSVPEPVQQLELDHVAVAVRSIKAAVPLFRDALGGEYLMGGDQGGTWRWVQFRYPGGGKVELLEPLGEGFVSRFLDRRGEGLHHITFKTDDIRGAIGRLEGLGYELVDVSLEDPDWKEAFLRPSGAHGTLIQIAQASQPDEVARERLRPSNLDELLG